MKTKTILVTFLALSLTNSAMTQDDKNLLNHLAVGIGVGSPGITLELAAPVTDYLAVRAGADIMPKLKFKTTVDIEDSKRRQLVSMLQQQQQTMDYFNIPNPTVPGEVDVEGKLNNTTGHVLIDVYPFRNADWHLTVGAYFGNKDVVNAYNTDDSQLKGVADYNNALSDQTFTMPDGTTFNGNDYKMGVRLGDYFLEPDRNGHVDAVVQVKQFRPYVGIGWGRAVPRHHTLGFSVDLGVQFWSKPKVYCQDIQLTEDNVEGDGGGVIKAISKVSVYPTLSFKLNCRLF